MIFSYRLHIIISSLVFIFSQARATTGGVPTSDVIHSSIVNIAFEKTVCSGVVIGENTVLTAAHCGSMGGKPLVVAYIQNKVKTSECNKRNVVDYAYEPTAKKTSFGSPSPDILLLKIEAPLCDAQLATLSLEALQTDDVVSLAGHGLWQAGHAITTQFEAKIINFENVATQINTDSNPKAGADIAKFLIDGPQNYIFAIPETKNSSLCPGDSGGPVFTESENGMILKGINGLTLANELLGSSICGNAYVQLFTPIYPYLEWIKGKMQEWK